MRPGDFVGAIANETDLTGREIGPIRISDNYSVVGVPEQAVDTVVKAIRATTIRGKKAKA
jgi:ATP-dependent RNA helicase DeaD